MPKIYSRRGDEGKTGLLYGGRISKTDARCEAYGTIDEAVSALGLARSLVNTKDLKGIIKTIQVELFTLGAELATDAKQYHKLQQHFSIVTQDMVDRLENLIDSLNSEITLPQAFIVPGTSHGSGALDLSRTIIRRAERQIVALKDMSLLENTNILKYVNRLADLIFVMARYEDRNTPFDTLTQ